MKYDKNQRGERQNNKTKRWVVTTKQQQPLPILLLGTKPQRSEFCRTEINLSYIKFVVWVRHLRKRIPLKTTNFVLIH